MIILEKYYVYKQRTPDKFGEEYIGGIGAIWYPVIRVSPKTVKVVYGTMSSGNKQGLQRLKNLPIIYSREELISPIIVNTFPSSKSERALSNRDKRAKIQKHLTDYFRLKGNSCFYCGVRFDWEILSTKDHLIPVSQGGRIIVPACKGCNNLKSSLSLIGFKSKLKSIITEGGYIQNVSDAFDRSCIWMGNGNKLINKYDNR